MFDLFNQHPEGDGNADGHDEPANEIGRYEGEKENTQSVADEPKKKAPADGVFE